MAQVSSVYWWFWLAPDELLPLTTDQLVTDGITYQFHGDPWVAYDIAGRPDHIEGTLVRSA